MSHNHCHNGCQDHDHSSSEELGIQYNLYEKIDKENLQCLNETVEGSGRTVFKPWESRLDTTHFVESDADEELLFNIPFTGNVKLKGIKVASENSDAHPSKLRLYKNKPNMTFDDVTLEPDQVFELHRDSEGVLEYAPKVHPHYTHKNKYVPLANIVLNSSTFIGFRTFPNRFYLIVTFSSVTHLTMHFPSNFGADNTKIYYIGLKGEWTQGHRHGVTICTYEARPNLDDHKLKHLDSVSKQID